MCSKFFGIQLEKLRQCDGCGGIKKDAVTEFEINVPTTVKESKTVQNFLEDFMKPEMYDRKDKELTTCPAGYVL